MARGSPRTSADADELSSFLGAALPKWKIPDRFVFVTEIPKTPVGKYAKRELREMFSGPVLPWPCTSPETGWLKMIPLGRYGAAEEIGAITAVLASPLGSFVTGSHVVVDGGQALTGSSTFNNAVEATIAASSR